MIERMIEVWGGLLIVLLLLMLFDSQERDESLPPTAGPNQIPPKPVTHDEAYRWN